MSREETIEICTRIDDYLGDKIAESILNNISYDKMEAHYGLCRFHARILQKKENGIKDAQQPELVRRRKQRTATHNTLIHA